MAILALISIVFVALYVYFTYYRDLFHQYRFEYVKRVLAIYLLALMVVATLLTVIQIAAWPDDPVVALKRFVIVAFPATMSAAVSDALS